MLCPVCDVDMMVLELEQVEVDFCLECRGVWLDRGELELIGARAGVLQDDLLAALESSEGGAAGEEKRRCPVCGKGLARVETRGGNVIELDRCGRGHGMWFDAGELSAVVRAAGAAEDNVLARFFNALEREKR